MRPRCMRSNSLVSGNKKATDKFDIELYSDLDKSRLSSPIFKMVLLRMSRYIAKLIISYIMAKVVKL